MYYLLLFHGNSGYANAPQSYFILHCLCLWVSVAMLIMRMRQAVTLLYSAYLVSQLLALHNRKPRICG